MNKKLLFGIMSLAALAACTNDDFESKNGAQVSEQVSPIQFEVINNAEVTRASMDGNSIAWSAADGDLFTLYHGAGAFSNPFAMTGYENATYKASEGEGGAVLTTPSVIKPGSAVMVWPADTAFNDPTSTAGFYKNASNKLAVKIPVTLENVENNIPYASDLIDIKAYAAYSETPATPGAIPTAYNTAGKDRKYAVYMRPMASQLILKADYAGTDAVINALKTGSDPIDPIALTSVEINDPTNGSLTQAIELEFTTPAVAPAAPQGTNWNTVENNSWQAVTGLKVGSAVGVNKLTTKCINGIESAKFLILPQGNIGAGGLGGASVVVNTLYGKVATTAYTPAELTDAWYRYMAPGTAVTYGETETPTAGTGSDASKVRYTQDIETGLAQVIDAFSANTTKKATSVVVNEPTGAVGTRYVKVLLSHLDMNGLHIKNDKHLYDAVRVWKEIGTGDVTVNLDGDKDGNFEISQKTIAKINEINDELAEETTPRKFNVTACNVAGEICNNIVITGGGAVKNMDFIIKAPAAANVVLKAGETWEWAASTTADKKLTVAPVATCGITSIINKGTFVSGATSTLAIYDNAAAPLQVTTIPFVNDGTWNVNAGDVNVQFDVTNNGTVNIKAGAEYHQDGTAFTNEATTLPEYFIPAATPAIVEQIGKIENKGVFASVNGGNINNYGLIEHADKDAKTYITTNQTGGSNFATAFGPTNKMGRINLPYSNKDENNLSINNAAATGFVSVTISTEAGAPNDGKLDLSTVGDYVNYCIIKSGVTEIKTVSTKIKYLEFNAGTTEIAWTDNTAATYTGLIVLSPVNIFRDKSVTATATYLGAKMYVGGTFTCTDYNAYYGDTSGNIANIITY